MVPKNLDPGDPCYLVIKRIKAILSEAEYQGLLVKRNVRLDTFFTQAGTIRAYRVNHQTKAGWQTVTFSEEDLSMAADDAYFQQHVAEPIKRILFAGDPDES